MLLDWCFFYEFETVFLYHTSFSLVIPNVYLRKNKMHDRGSPGRDMLRGSLINNDGSWILVATCWSLIFFFALCLENGKDFLVGLCLYLCHW